MVKVDHCTCGPNHPAHGPCKHPRRAWQQNFRRMQDELVCRDCPAVLSSVTWELRDLMFRRPSSTPSPEFGRMV